MSKLKVKRIGVVEILGREIEFYGSWEEPLFLGKAVAEWIGHSNPSKMLKSIDEDEKATMICDITNGYGTSKRARNTQEMLFVTEDGLYEALMQSRKDIAKELKKQIKQYLKNIRKTGAAIEVGKEEEMVEKYFPTFSEELKTKMALELIETNKKLQEENAVLKPKAKYHDEVLNPPRLKSTTEIAKDLGMTAQKLNKALNEKGVIYPKKVKDKTIGWYLYSGYDKLVPEYADYKISEYSQQLKWTELGRKLIIAIVKDEKNVEEVLGELESSIK